MTLVPSLEALAPEALPEALSLEAPAPEASPRKQPLAAAVSVALATSFSAAPAAAQQEQFIDEVVVTAGYRKSLIDSIEEKRDSALVIEAISAEDIGKLPDQSIADAIARLPGIAAQRLDGRASSISIRGLGENFSATTINGREQVSIGDNRGVEFDLYPSEIVSGVVVYKTPNAALANQGIGGVIDMRTTRPLDHDELIAKFSVFGEYSDIGKLNPDGEEYGYRATASYIDQYGDVLGVAVVVNKTVSPNNEERWNAWGYPTNGDGGPWILGGAKPFVRSSELERDSVAAVLQFAPTDGFNLTLDGMYIDFADEKILRGIEIPGTWGGPGGTEVLAVRDGFVTNAVYAGRSPVVRNDYEIREAELLGYGLNAEFILSDTLEVEVDVAHSEVERDIWSLESYATGSGRPPTHCDTAEQMDLANQMTYPHCFREQDMKDENGEVVKDADGEPIKETVPTGQQIGHRADDPRLAHIHYDQRDVSGVWFNPLRFNEAGELVPFDYTDRALVELGAAQTWGNDRPDITTGQDGYINLPTVADELDTYRLDITHSTDGVLSSVQWGAYYSEREKERDDRGRYLMLNAADEPEANRPIPDEYYLGTTELDFIGIPGIASYDTFRFWEDGQYRELNADSNDLGRTTNDYKIKEEVTIAYAMVNLDFDVPGIEGMSLNLGLQWVDTEQSAEGAVVTGSDDDGPIVEMTEVKDSYKEWLPSLSWNTHILEDLVLRIGASRTQSRSRMDRLNVGGSFGFDTERMVYTYNGGNPYLRPNQADQADASLEYYFADDGYVAIAAYYKELKNWQTEEDLFFRVSDLVEPEQVDALLSDTLRWSTWTEADGGEITGVEFTAALPFGIFHDSIDGLGLVVSVSTVDSSIDNPDFNEEAEESISNQRQTAVPGLSEEVINVTVYYERAGFEGRVSMRQREDFLGERFGVSFRREPTAVVGSTLWDAQFSYSFGELGIRGLEGLTLTAQALNITNEPYENRERERGGLTLDYQEFGRTFLAGISYQF